MFKDGAGASYDASTNQFVTVPFGSVLKDPLNPGAGQSTNPTGLFYELFNYGAYTGTGTDSDPFTGAGISSFRAKADNTVAGEMRDCGECHVGGGWMEYVQDPAKQGSGTYDPAARTSLRDYLFNGAVTAFNALVDIFNPDPAKRGDVVVQEYGKSGVLEMDCLMCHMKEYSWSARKEAVRKGEFDASRAAGANLAKAVVDGTTVVYDEAAVSTDAQGRLVVDLSAKLNATPEGKNCASCHLSQYNVDWKKRGEQWLEGSDVHYGIGCMGCHQRSDSTTVGTEGVINGKLGLCDPAKGGNSSFDALWNKLDGVNFKSCASCHEPAATPTYDTHQAPNSVTAHANKGLSAKIAFDKDGKPASHLDIIDCTACHIRKTFDGGAFVDGTGPDEEGRLALHDEPQVGRDMTNGNALYWDNGKLYAANLLTSFFIRDMNGMDPTNDGIDVNNDGRSAGMDPFLQTHVNNIDHANGLKAITREKNADGSWVNETELGTLLTAMGNGIKGELGVSTTAPVLPKVSFLMVPFKASHNIASRASFTPWGANGCADCHAPSAGFYNGTYPLKGNLDGFQNATSAQNAFRFKSDQVTAFTKVNGLADVTDSHPSVVTKKGDRTVPVPLLTRFDTPYVAGTAAVGNQTLRNLDRSEVIYEATFQTRDASWLTAIVGQAPPAACSGATSPFYCADPLGNGSPESIKKAHATSTKGWLIKIEVRPAGDADPSHITFRTAQLGKDNATSMSEVVAALPASFTNNADFTVTEAGGALTITAAAGKELRLSPMTDAAPFGLKAKLWKGDPIPRGLAANGNQSTGRAQYVAYLDSLNDPAAYGIGIDPQAAIDPVADADPVTTGIQVLVGAPVALSCPPAQYLDANGNGRYDAGERVVGSVTYAWSSNDANATVTGAGTRTPSFTFATTGVKTITLTVTDEEQKSKTTSVTVNAVAAGIGATWTHTGGIAPAATGTLALTGLPGTTKSVKIYWGDGTTGALAVPVGNTTAEASHGYATGTAKTVQIYAYDALGVKVGFQQKTITP